MFRITEDPSSGSLVQCLAKNYTNGWSLSSSLTQLVYLMVEVYLHYYLFLHYLHLLEVYLHYLSNVNTPLPSNKQVVLD